jgi:multicomponent Na+:H+ antiporter subunit F
MTKILIACSLYLSITIFLCLYRGVKGPTLADRIIAINVIGTKTVVIIAVVSYAINEKFFLDVSLVYALISFLATVYISKLKDIEQGEN